VSHAVYDTRYHLVWAPKYRKCILRDEVREYRKRVFREIGERYEFEMEVEMWGQGAQWGGSVGSG